MRALSRSIEQTYLASSTSAKIPAASGADAERDVDRRRERGEQPLSKPDVPV